MNAPETLGTALPEEIERVAELREVYLQMPLGTGRPAALMMRVSLDKARTAIATGDVVEQLHSLKDLRGYTG